MKNLQALIEKHTNDGVLDYKTIEDAINDEINKTVAKNKPNQEKLIADSKSEWIKSLGFENVENEEQLKSYVKGTSNEWKETHDNIVKEFNAFKDSVKDYDDLKGKVSSYGNRALLREKGITDPDMVEFYEFKINKQEGETFADKLTAFETANPKTFQSKQITTGAKGGMQISKEGKYGFEEILEERGKI